MTNNAEDGDDEGTVWFDDTGAEDKTIQLLDDLSGSLAPESARILDLGTGNGHFLFALREEGWQGELIGVDYSDASVDLARQILLSRQATWDAEQDEPDSAESISFQKWDILGDQPGQWMGQGFDIVHDKGTFDAVSLSAQTDAQGRRVCETYRERITPLIKPGKFLVITSCNWTKDELLGWFADGPLTLHAEVKYPTYTFGGQSGQSVCTLVFQNKAR